MRGKAETKAHIDQEDAMNIKSQLKAGQSVGIIYE
jgi:hypothetical protein